MLLSSLHQAMTPSAFLAPSHVLGLATSTQPQLLQNAKDCVFPRPKVGHILPLRTERPSSRLQLPSMMSSEAAGESGSAKLNASSAPTEFRREDYQPTPYKMPKVELQFDLRKPENVIVSQTAYYEQSGSMSSPEDLALDMNQNQCEVTGATLDGNPIPFELSDGKMIIAGDLLAGKKQFKLDIITKLHPDENTTLAGLYGSDALLSTQCEAEGFRNITPVQDRPDILSEFTTTILTKPGQFSTTLSNGNPVDQGVTAGGDEFVTWHDPFPKPSYLFALVAGNMAENKDTFTTQSGRKIELCIHAAPEDIDKTGYAMESLKKAMAWDEEKFGLEYDLDRFNVVSIDDFNMGAMENKGLNIFNSRLILASPETATDADYQSIESVIGHEYFHNWSGNRVTCRDWFQLSLKEGLTVFRDQEFSSDMNSRSVKRIEDVIRLRQAQFPEDAGPMAHPIRPERVQRFDNFYTATVYQKGAEVVRMIQTLAGKEGFRKGLDLYFKRHDGTAATCEDFVKSMEDANSLDLTQFRRWYSQAGTPQVQVKESYSPESKEYQLTFEQTLEPTAAKTPVEPMVIPMNVGLLSKAGKALKIEGQSERKIVVTEPAETFTFSDIETCPVPSIGRGFSAPVQMRQDRTNDSLLTQFSHDSDLFNRYEAGQILMKNIVQSYLKDDAQGGNRAVLQLGRRMDQQLGVRDLDKNFKAMLLSIPSVSTLKTEYPKASLDDLVAARAKLKSGLVNHMSSKLRDIVAQFQAQEKQFTVVDEKSIGDRALKNKALSLLAPLGVHNDAFKAQSLFKTSRNLTDRLGALSALVQNPKLSAYEFQKFDKESKTNPLVRLKFLSLVASSDNDSTLDQVKALWNTIDKTNPNSVYSLLGGFMSGSFMQFHREDGEGYRFAAECILEVDRLNPQAASRMLNGFQIKPTLDAGRQSTMNDALTIIASASDISVNTREKVSKLIA